MNLMNSNGPSYADSQRSGAQKSTPVTSAILRDGALLEMLHDPVRCSTSFVHAAGREVQIVAQYELPDGRSLRPLSPLNNLLTHAVVLFASEPTEFGSKAELLAQVQDYVHQYCDLSPLFEQIASHYVLLSWLGDSFNEVPYLRVLGPPGSGKTRFLLTVGALCYKPIFASGASTVSPLFRLLDSIGGTLVLDEADFRFSTERADIVKILNHGTVRGFPVLRSEQNASTKEFNPFAYHVFGPKLVAARSEFDDPALETRFISERLGDQPLRSDVPISLDARHGSRAQELRNRLLSFRLSHRHMPRRRPAMAAHLDPRLQQMFGPLLELIDDAGRAADVMALARQYQRDLIYQRGAAIEGRLLETVRDLAGDRPGKALGVKDVAIAFRRKFQEDFAVPVTPSWIGAQLRRRLGVSTYRTRSGYVLPVEDLTRLSEMYERYGLVVDAADPPPEGSRGSPASPG